jgi:sulfatase maturation enzyme AslB (radical SAM superfamily)
MIGGAPAPWPEHEELPAPLLAMRPWEKCGDCPYISVCVGGCLGTKWLRTGRVDEVHCQREAFATNFRESVVRRYLAEFETHSGWQEQETAA